MAEAEQAAAFATRIRISGEAHLWERAMPAIFFPHVSRSYMSCGMLDLTPPGQMLEQAPTHAGNVLIQ